jgi:hypothetical protein
LSSEVVFLFERGNAGIADGSWRLGKAEEAINVETTLAGRGTDGTDPSFVCVFPEGV